MKWPYLILRSPWERCNCIKTLNPCPYNCYRCLSLLSPLPLSIARPPSVSSRLSLKSSKSVLHNLMFYFLSSQNGTCVISRYVFVDLLWCFPNSLQFKSPDVHNPKSRLESAFQEANKSAYSSKMSRKTLSAQLLLFIMNVLHYEPLIVTECIFNLWRTWNNWSSKPL